MSGLGIGFAMAGTWLGKAAALVPEKARLALVLIAVAGACFFLGQCRGVGKERTAWEAQAARIALAAEQLQRAADTYRNAMQAADQARITRNRQEVDDALSALPDRAPTDRQRVRACLELRRQASAAGQPEPAC